MIQIAPPQGRFITREKAKNPNSLKLVALIVLSFFFIGFLYSSHHFNRWRSIEFEGFC